MILGDHDSLVTERALHGVILTLSAQSVCPCVVTDTSRAWGPEWWTSSPNWPLALPQHWKNPNQWNCMNQYVTGVINTNGHPPQSSPRLQGCLPPDIDFVWIVMYMLHCIVQCVLSLSLVLMRCNWSITACYLQARVTSPTLTTMLSNAFCDTCGHTSFCPNLRENLQ